MKDALNSFNLGLVFGNGEFAFIISCSSDNEIDEEHVNFVATKAFKHAVKIYKDLTHVIQYMAEEIENNCGCKALVTKEDGTCLIPKNN